MERFELGFTREYFPLHFSRAVLNQISPWFKHPARIFSSLILLASPLFCTFRPMSQSRSLPVYEIFSQFFLDRPTLSRFLSSRSALRGKRIRPFLNDFTIRYTETPSLQRICIRMRCKKDLLAKTRLRIKGREG